MKITFSFNRFMPVVMLTTLISVLATHYESALLSPLLILVSLGMIIGAALASITVKLKKDTLEIINDEIYITYGK